MRSLFSKKKNYTLNLSPKEENHAKPKVFTLSVGVLIFVSLCLLWSTGYYYKQYIDLRKGIESLNNVKPKTGTRINDASSTMQSAVPRPPDAEVLMRISRLVSAPKGEVPVYAEITSLESLRGQPFFADAHVGDLMLTFCKSRISALYAVKEDRLIRQIPEVVAELCQAK